MPRTRGLLKKCPISRTTCEAGWLPWREALDSGHSPRGPKARSRKSARHTAVEGAAIGCACTAWHGNLDRLVKRAL